jgi:hypothetical protein
MQMCSAVELQECCMTHYVFSGTCYCPYLLLCLFKPLVPSRRLLSFDAIKAFLMEGKHL